MQNWDGIGITSGFHYLYMFLKDAQKHLKFKYNSRYLYLQERKKVRSRPYPPLKKQNRNAFIPAKKRLNLDFPK